LRVNQEAKVMAARWIGIGIAAVVVAAALGAAGDGEGEGEKTAGGLAHADPAAIEKAYLDATRAFLHEDIEGVKDALGRIEDGCRRLNPTPEIPSTITSYDRAFHTAVTMAREDAERGRFDKCFEQYYWIQKGCVECHRRSIEHGLLPTAKTAAPGEEP
jgi:hypothetical protein